MPTLQEMHQRTVACKEFDQMIRSIAPMCDYFNVNHFYYTRIQASGDQAYCSFLGTHVGWHEYLIENFETMVIWPNVRHPDKLVSQVTLFKNTINSEFDNHLEMVWDKFKINFSVDIRKKNSGGIESYGFGVKSLHPKAEEHFLNELPLLKQLGFGALLSLTAREIDILQFMASGLPANYIAQKLHLSCRTVENYIAAIKSKLDCDSKVELIKKAQDIVSVISPS